MLRDYAIKDSKSSDSEYAAVTTAHTYKPNCDVKMNANPAYHATSYIAIASL